MSEELTRRIETLIMPSIEDGDAELVELRVRPRGGNTSIDVLVDKPHGGITLEECSFINRKIFGRLEETQILGDDFVVEVASPGLDRPLATAKDFLRVQGHTVRFHLKEPHNDKLEYRGVVKGVEREKVLVETHNGLIELPIGTIGKAMQI